MGEVLRKYSGLASWIGLVANLIIIGYWSGTIQAHQNDQDRRLVKIETSDEKQNDAIKDFVSRQARIEEGVMYIKEAIKEKK